MIIYKTLHVNNLIDYLPPFTHVEVIQTKLKCLVPVTSLNLLLLITTVSPFYDNLITFLKT